MSVTVFLLLSAAGCATNRTIVLNDNGGWCWYQDERVLVHGNRLVLGSVANRSGTDGERRWGNIEITAYDLKDGKLLGTSVLHEHLQDDDHDVPGLLFRADGRILAAYSMHGNDKLMRYRISAGPCDTTEWQPERQETRGAGVTYSNLFRLSAENGGQGRIYNFYRGEDWNPNFVVSDDEGQTWTYAGKLVAFKGRPYVKYASNGVDRIHFVTTEGHPLECRKTGIYHGFIRDGAVYRSDDTFVRKLSDGPVAPEELTRVYAGDLDHAAWTVDLHLDKAGHPYTVYSVQMNQDPNDNRYRYACWDGSRWCDYNLAFAGTYLCPGEIHYTGLACLDPQNPSVLYVSTNADPETGSPLLSKADGKRHYEIFRGRTLDGGATWKWRPITHDSREDNLRPIVPVCDGRNSILLWLRGTYSMYTNYDLDVVGVIGRTQRDSLGPGLGGVEFLSATGSGGGDVSPPQGRPGGPADLPPGRGPDRGAYLREFPGVLPARPPSS